MGDLVVYFHRSDNCCLAVACVADRYVVVVRNLDTDSAPDILPDITCSVLVYFPSLVHGNREGGEVLHSIEWPDSGAVFVMFIIEVTHFFGAQYPYHCLLGAAELLLPSVDSLMMKACPC